MIKILMEGMTKNKGGKETYIINIFDAIDKNKFEVSFIAYDETIAFEKYLLDHGAEIFHLPPRCNGLIKHKKALDNLFASRHFDVVWSHKTTLSACEVLISAKRYGVPIRIIHSHSSSNMGGKFTYIMHTINKVLLPRWATDFFACSEEAAVWFYGKRKAKIMTNAIDLQKFRFNQSMREEIRKEYNLSGYFVVGHVGRFSFEKNHHKLIDVFMKLKEKRVNSKLVLCGDGAERKKIEQHIANAGLQDDVLLLGVVDNVHQILQAFDVMVMPSLFEGLPFALLEAQASGLKCVVSETVSQESDVLGCNRFIGLNKSDEFWANVILSIDETNDRVDAYKEMQEKGFGIKDNIAYVEKLIAQTLNDV